MIVTGAKRNAEGNVIEVKQLIIQEVEYGEFRIKHKLYLTIRKIII
jgi:hypothetical protein